MRQSGKSFGDPLVVLIVAPNELGSVRIAVVAGRSVGGAVLRNRAKRICGPTWTQYYLAWPWDGT